jgi:hypothetical protein
VDRPNRPRGVLALKQTVTKGEFLRSPGEPFGAVDAGRGVPGELMRLVAEAATVAQAPGYRRRITDPVKLAAAVVMTITPAMSWPALAVR